MKTNDTSGMKGVKGLELTVLDAYWMIFNFLRNQTIEVA